MQGSLKIWILLGGIAAVAAALGGVVSALRSSGRGPTAPIVGTNATRERTGESGTDADEGGEKKDAWVSIFEGADTEKDRTSAREDTLAREFEIAPQTQRLTFVSGSVGLPVEGEWRGRPALADFDADGNLDIAASVRKGDGLHVFFGDGAGNWHERGEPFPKNLGYGGIDAGDFNHDGHMDLAFSTHGAPIQVFVGDGKGGWTNSSEGCMNDQIVEDLAVADFNGDGNLDIVGIAWSQGGLYLFLGDGRGRWSTYDVFPGDDEDFGHAIAAADIDGDGHQDIAVTLGGPKVFLGDGTGKFKPATQGLPVPPTKGTCWAVSLGDVDGNGTLELAVAFSAMEGMRGIGVYRMDENKVWTSISEGLPWFTSFHDAVLGDLDGDGKADLVGYTEENVLVWRGNGGSSWTAAGMVPNLGRSGVVAIGDLNRDGRNDIVAVFQQKRSGVQALFQR